jgi:hypothetical protein
MDLKEGFLQVIRSSDHDRGYVRMLAARVTMANATASVRVNPFPGPVVSEAVRKASRGVRFGNSVDPFPCIFHQSGKFIIRGGTQCGHFPNLPEREEVPEAVGAFRAWIVNESPDWDGYPALAAIGDDPALRFALPAAQIVDPFRHFSPCLFGPTRDIWRKPVCLEAKIIEGRLAIEPFFSFSGRSEELRDTVRTVRLNDRTKDEEPSFLSHRSLLAAITLKSLE